ncbi:hypothetical protein ACQPZJ_35545 [Actinoplanes sp. CA-054009]
MSTTVKGRTFAELKANAEAEIGRFFPPEFLTAASFDWAISTISLDPDRDKAEEIPTYAGYINASAML